MSMYITNYNNNNNNNNNNKRPILIFQSGSEKLNPVLFFILVEFESGYIGGLVTGLIHT